MMQFSIAVAAISLLQMPIAPVEPADVGFEELTAERNDAAIRSIEANTRIEADDPARLINLGIAHAREGRIAEARAAFDAVLRHDDRVQLETATGDWVDSRHLAKRAMTMLAAGEFNSGTRFAKR
ncbi:MAG: hypothetical protein WA948_10275 [Pontixanthobacter sp.]